MNTQQFVIASLTAIALTTLISLTISVLVAHLHDLEIFALYFNVISGVVGALAGLYMGKRLETDTINDNTINDNANEKI